MEMFLNITKMCFMILDGVTDVFFKRFTDPLIKNLENGDGIIYSKICENECQSNVQII